MKGVVAALAALLLPAFPGAARQQQQNDPVESRVQRLREQLQLTEAQVAKVREIYKKQYDDVRSVLTDEQRRRYEETGRGPGGGTPGTPGGTQGRGGARPTGGLPRIEDMKTQVNLSEDQVPKVEAILNAYREETRNFFRNRGGGGGNPQDFQTQFQKARDTASGKIRELLNADQRTKFDALLNAAPTLGNRGAGTGGFGAGGGRGGSIDERVNSALLALRIEDAKEADAIKGVIKKVIELMEKVETYQRESRTKLEAASRATDLADEVVGERIEEVRKGQRDLEKELNTARRELMAIVTNRQELELVRRGILK